MEERDKGTRKLMGIERLLRDGETDGKKETRD